MNDDIAMRILRLMEEHLKHQAELTTAIEQATQASWKDYAPILTFLLGFGLNFWLQKRNERREHLKEVKELLTELRATASTATHQSAEILRRANSILDTYSKAPADTLRIRDIKKAEDNFARLIPQSAQQLQQPITESFGPEDRQGKLEETLDAYQSTLDHCRREFSSQARSIEQYEDETAQVDTADLRRRLSESHRTLRDYMLNAIREVEKPD